MAGDDDFDGADAGAGVVVDDDDDEDPPSEDPLLEELLSEDPLLDVDELELSEPDDVDESDPLEPAVEAVDFPRLSVLKNPEPLKVTPTG